MAGPIVHNIFFEECLLKNDLEIEYLNLYSENCNIYAQGHDLLMYIQIWNFKKNQKVSLQLSHVKFREFVYHYLDISIKNRSIYRDIQIKLFIYGYISHHILDSYIHPFIMKYSKEYLPQRGTYWLHGVLETYFDGIFIKKYKKESPILYKIHNDFLYKKVKSIEFIENIELAVKQTYKINGVGKKFSKSFRSLHHFMYLYRYDPHKVKRAIGNLLDQYWGLGIKDYFFDNCNLQWKDLPEKGKNLVNDFKKEYQTALRVTIKVFCEIEKILKEQQLTQELIEDIVPNRSAITGDEPCRYITFSK